MEQLCRVLAKDLGARNITVNTISPGPVDTPLFREGKTEQQIQFIAGLNPSNRLGLPDDIAPVVNFLASPAASWVNGQNIMVNGVRIHPRASGTWTDFVVYRDMWYSGFFRFCILYLLPLTLVSKEKYHDLI